MKIYMKVTDDKYEHPVAIADSQGELAEMLGVTKNCIASALCHARQGRNRSVYKEVDIGDDDS
jgi:hypothetical protein